MAEQSNNGYRIDFGPFEVDVAAGQVSKNGRLIRLPEQPLQVLVALLGRPGEVVIREEMQEKLWAGQTYVDFDQGLNNAINKLRDALGDSAANPRYIETLRQRGYRFIHPLAEEDNPNSPPPPNPDPRHSRNTPNRDTRLNPEHAAAPFRANSWGSCGVTNDR